MSMYNELTQKIKSLELELNKEATNLPFKINIITEYDDFYNILNFYYSSDAVQLEEFKQEYEKIQEINKSEETSYFVTRIIDDEEGHVVLILMESSKTTVEYVNSIVVSEFLYSLYEYYFAHKNNEVMNDDLSAYVRSSFKADVIDQVLIDNEKMPLPEMIENFMAPSLVAFKVLSLLPTALFIALKNEDKENVKKNALQSFTIIKDNLDIIDNKFKNNDILYDKIYKQTLSEETEFPKMFNLGLYNKLVYDLITDYSIEECANMVTDCSPFLKDLKKYVIDKIMGTNQGIARYVNHNTMISYLKQ